MATKKTNNMEALNILFFLDMLDMNKKEITTGINIANAAPYAVWSL